MNGVHYYVKVDLLQTVYNKSQCFGVKPCLTVPQRARLYTAVCDRVFIMLFFPI